MDNDFGFNEPLDVILCRNVIIGFDRPTQARLLANLADLHALGRFLSLNHSETQIGLNLRLSEVAPLVYCKV